ncbi:YkoP family protein [Peribacillus asahii]|uniref:YkoP family protein n=1 Tax=Peribacillus asahii TaxID=228899 RepID=UPI00214AA525|nr:hypothetical protein [Peribacillus asahii]
MRNYLLNIWNLVDPIYYRLSHLNYLPEKNILRVKLTRYKGRNVILSDGTAINKNDLLIKIHLHNAVLLKELKTNQKRFKKRSVCFSSCQRIFAKSSFICSTASSSKTNQRDYRNHYIE